MVKHRQLAPTVGPLANNRLKNSMASLDDTPVLEKAPPFASALGSSSRTDQAVLKAAQPITIFQKLQKPQNTVNSMNSSINSRNRISEPQQRSLDSTRIRRNQSQNTLRIGRELGKIAGRSQARNFQEQKDHTFQLHPRC